MNDPLTPPTGLASLVASGAVALPKAVAKLVDTLGMEIGLWLKPHHTRRQAEADAYAAITKADASEQIKVKKVGTNLLIEEIEARADQRRRQTAVRQQENIEAVAAQAARVLGSTGEVSDSPVDPDWVTGFLGHCQDVSSEQMQVLWGKLLAGEVAKPGSFSLRTLAAVNTLTKDDAEKFTRFCSIVWDMGSGSYVPIVAGHFYDPDQDLPIQWHEIEELDDLGLVRKGTGGYTFKSVNGIFPLRYFDKEYLFHPADKPLQAIFDEVAESEDKRPKGLAQFDIETGPYMLTQVGKELVPLAGAKPDVKYRDRVLKRLVPGMHKLAVVDMDDIMVLGEDGTPQPYRPRSGS